MADQGDDESRKREENRQRILARRKRFLASTLLGVTAVGVTAVAAFAACEPRVCLKYSVPHDAAEDTPEAAPVPDANTPSDAGGKG